MWRQAEKMKEKTHTKKKINKNKNEHNKRYSYLSHSGALK